MVNEIDYSEISNSELILDVIENTEFKGFKEDYLVIHYLLKKWKPKHIFEIGTNTGNGCRIMHNASPESKISTLDIMENCGQMCPKDVKKYCGDSMNFDFSSYYPIDCWFIDGHHVYQNVYYETKQALKSDPNYIIYHDADIQEVTDGILDAFVETDKNLEYNLYRIINPPHIYSSTGKNITRILFAEKKNINHMKIYSIHYNKPEYIVIQKKLFDKFINFGYSFIVVNNAFDSYLKDEIERQCEELEIKCIICDNQIQKMSSMSHQNSFKYIISDVKDNESFLIVDHDIFLISRLNIEYFDNYDLVYLPQTRNNVEYPWPGLIYFKNLKDKTNISFNSGNINGNSCDTGGELYYYIQNSKNINIKKIKEQYVHIDTDKVSILDSIFLHLIGGSGWSKEINLEKKIKYLEYLIK